MENAKVAEMQSKNSEPEYRVGYGRPPKEAQFKPGVSGNPGGRPKGSVKMSTCYERALARLVPDDPLGRNYGQLIADNTVERGVNDLDAAKEAADRNDGKATQAVTIGGTDQTEEEVNEMVATEAATILELVLTLKPGLRQWLSERVNLAEMLILATDEQDIKLLDAHGGCA